jgi:hypothetical protein
MPESTLDDLRDCLQREAPYVGIKPFSHNIVRITLVQIEQKFGRAEANKAVRDFRLKRKGFNEEPEEPPEGEPDAPRPRKRGRRSQRPDVQPE